MLYYVSVSQSCASGAIRLRIVTKRLNVYVCIVEVIWGARPGEKGAIVYRYCCTVYNWYASSKTRE